MKPSKAFQTLTLASIGAFLACPVLAQEGGYSYLGLSAGQSRAKIDEANIAANLLGAGLATTSIVSDERDATFKLFGGYQLNRNIAVEAGYFDLGRFGFAATTVPAGTLNGQIRLQGLNLDLVGTLPVSEKFSLIARAGAQNARARDRFTGTGVVAILNAGPSRRETNYKLGLGMQYEISPSVLLRAEAERYRVNDAVGSHGDINVFTVGLVFPFGRTPPVIARSVPAPMYQAPAPAPAPAPVAARPAAPAPVVVAAAPPVAAVVVAPARRRVSFSAESLFAFDQSSIRPEGKAALDAFAKDVRSTQFDVVTVEGHTDRIGSTPYNQVLSQHRADAVKSYLISEGRIDPGKISATGKGESVPVTKPADCKGSKATPALIACLQPDRRVDIELTGTR